MQSRNDQQKISGALHKIEEEDPTFKVTREAQTHEMVMQGMSELHLQIVQNRLQKRDKVDVVTHQPKIAYRETIAGAKDGSYRHKKQSGGSGQFAEVHLRVSALPQGIKPEEYFTKERFDHLREYHYDPVLNFAFVDRVTGGTVPNQYIPAVEKGVIERMTRGVAAGFQIQDVCVEIYFGKDHPVDSNETAFRMAGSMCFRNLFREAKPQLLEPIARAEIYVPGDKLGAAPLDDERHLVVAKRVGSHINSFAILDSKGIANRLLVLAQYRQIQRLRLNQRGQLCPHDFEDLRLFDAG